MPPKKKNRLSARRVSTPNADDDSLVVDTPDASERIQKPEVDITQDLWTDEQETSLFKGILKWKLAGMHKHFRMIALSGYLRNHGYDPTIATHTRIAGIWEKLGTLYNLEAIDEREDFEDEDDDSPEDRYKEFQLPLEQFGTDMMERGRDRDASESPPVQERSLGELQAQLPATKKRKRESTNTNIHTRIRGSSRIRGSTVDDTDEPRTSPAPRPGRRGRSAKAKRGSIERQASRGTTVETESTKDDNEGTVAETEEGEDEEEEDDEVDEADTPSPKAARGRPKGSKSSTQTVGRQRKSKRRR